MYCMPKFKEFPIFKKGEVQKLYKKLPSSERKIIEDFVKYVSITSKSPKRLENNRRTLTQFRVITNKNFDAVTLEDLRGCLAFLNSSNKTNATQNDFKASVKRFLRWKFKDWSERFDELRDIKLIMKINEEKINASTLLKKEDVEAIMKAEPKLYWKTFFITLYESALRPNELRNLKWKDIKFNIEEGCISEINVYATKTHRARSVYVKEATYYLMELKKRSKNDILVFPASRDPNKPLDRAVASVWLNRISERVLGRRVYPYILRHSRATELYTNPEIPDKICRKIMGHSKSMEDVYTHLSNEDVKETLGKTIYQLKDLPPEKKHKLEKEIDLIKEDNQKIAKSLLKLMEMFQNNPEISKDIVKKEWAKIKELSPA